ncbi:MAG: SPFH domain-containing protein [Acidobacteriota bacterium]
MNDLLFLAIAIVTLLITWAGLALIIAKCHRRVSQGQALIINRMRTTAIHFRGAVVLPVLHQAETMNISAHSIVVERRGDDGVPCRDEVKADLRATFALRVNTTRDDILTVARVLGTERASSTEALEQLFSPRFSEALETAARHVDFDSLARNRDELRNHVQSELSDELEGWVIDSLTIDRVERSGVGPRSPP